MSEGIEPIRLTDEQRLDWLRLIRSQNVGPRTFRALLNHFGGARAALEVLPTLARRGGASAPQICSREQAQREIEACAKFGVALVVRGEAHYPRRLQMIDDAPPLVAIRGNAAVLALPPVAIVGSRNASAAGVKITERLTRGLCEVGFATVSGLARGIDAAAHRASIATGTVAVLAGGQDRVYPPEHADLLEAARSGSLITARLALEQGREVFAVPGSPLDPRAEGTNSLIKQGGTPVTEADDIVSVLRPIIGADLPAREDDAEEAEKSQAEPAPDERARVIALLSPAPVSIDDLIRLSATSPRIVRMVLLELEIPGRIERHGGGLVSLI